MERLTGNEAANLRTIDGVSSATLTSRAIQQGIQKRLGAEVVASKFEASFDLKEVQNFFPDAHRVESHASIVGLWEVKAESGRSPGPNPPQLAGRRWNRGVPGTDRGLACLGTDKRSHRGQDRTEF